MLCAKLTTARLGQMAWCLGSKQTPRGFFTLVARIYCRDFGSERRGG